ncbi:MAG: hypothetical protein K9M45_14295 [Kiritimatiellales bacterium]|nr:hypothetical protein [Kiritimatiellales bacterium]
MYRTTICLLLICSAAFAKKKEPEVFQQLEEYRFWPAYKQQYFTEPQLWVQQDHAIPGWDWSLPPSVKPSDKAYVQLGHAAREPVMNLPVRPVVEMMWNWKDLEPEEGKFNFQPLIGAISEWDAKGYGVALKIRASVYDKLAVPANKRPPKWYADHVSAPDWLKQYNIPVIHEEPKKSFQIVNYDILHPEYHQRYLRFIEKLGGSGIPRMDAVKVAYLGFKSSSQGEEGGGPHEPGPDRVFEKRALERYDAWAKAFKGVEDKLLPTGGGKGKQEQIYQQHAYDLGMGQRSGFVEMFLYNIPNPALGQVWTKAGYLEIDESCPPIRYNRAFGDENEEYETSWVHRFGAVESYPFRYWVSMLRALQMRRSYLMVNDFTLDPKMLHWVCHELGRTVDDTPDAWCALRENTIQSNNRTGPVKNFERWLYQRDPEEYKTEPAIAIPHAIKMWMVPKGEVFDYIARKGKKIGFAIDDRYLFGHCPKAAIKITYHDIGNSLVQLLCLDKDGQPLIRSSQCEDTGALKTVTFIIEDADFNGKVMDNDFVIRATTGEAVISMVRIIKL